MFIFPHFFNLVFLMSSHTPPSFNSSEMKQSGEEVVLGKRNSKKTKRFQDEVTTIPINTRLRWKAQEKGKNANSTSSSKSQKKKTSSNSTRRKGKKQSLPMKEAKKKIPKGGDEVFTDSEEELKVKVTTSKKNPSSKSKKGKRKRRKKSGDRSSLNNLESHPSRNLKKKEREEQNQKFAKLNKLYGCYANDNERAAKKKLMELMTFLEESTLKQLKDQLKSNRTDVKDEMKSSQTEVKDKFAMICEDFIDGNHPTKILHKSWNEKFVKIMGSISYQPLRRQQMVLNLLTSADLTDDQRVKVFNALETSTIAKLPFLEMTEEFLPSCDPLEFDQDSLMKKADLKLRHNGISKSWNLITSSSTPNHQFTKEEIMEYIDGDEDFDFFDLYKGFYEFDLFSFSF